MISPSMQAFMDSSDWLKSIEESGSGSGIDSSTCSPPTELIACSRPPVLERRLRPPHDQALKCPRCDSTHTKFCYYNNYSLSQPRYFCKTCRRYWTKGGSLRNVPVGGGCRKNKRSSGKKPAEQPPLLGQLPQPISCFHDATDLHLSFSLPHHEASLPGSPHGLNFMDCNPMLGLELMESKFGVTTGMLRNHCHYLGGSGSGSGGGIGLGNMNQSLLGTTGFHGLNPLSFSNHGSIMEAYQRMSSLPPFGGQEMNHEPMDVKPAERMLTLEWQEPGCAEAGRDSFGYTNGLGLWAGMIEEHGSSAAI